MQRITTALLVLLLVSTMGWGAPALKDKKPDDSLLILGVWSQESLSLRGGPVSESVPGSSFRFGENNACGITNAGHENGAKYFLDTTTTPRRMKWLNGSELTEWLCVYELQGDTLKVAFVKPGAEPPHKVEPHENLTIYYLKRVKN